MGGKTPGDVTTHESDGSLIGTAWRKKNAASKLEVSGSLLFVDAISRGPFGGLGDVFWPPKSFDRYVPKTFSALPTSAKNSYVRAKTSISRKLQVPGNLNF